MSWSSETSLGYDMCMFISGNGQLDKSWSTKPSRWEWRHMRQTQSQRHIWIQMKKGICVFIRGPSIWNLCLIWDIFQRCSRHMLQVDRLQWDIGWKLFIGVTELHWHEGNSLVWSYWHGQSGIHFQNNTANTNTNTLEWSHLHGLLSGQWDMHHTPRLLSS